MAQIPILEICLDIWSQNFLPDWSKELPSAPRCIAPTLQHHQWRLRSRRSKIMVNLRRIEFQEKKNRRLGMQQANICKNKVCKNVFVQKIVPTCKLGISSKSVREYGIKWCPKVGQSLDWGGLVDTTCHQQPQHSGGPKICPTDHPEDGHF